MMNRIHQAALLLLLAVVPARNETCEAPRRTFSTSFESLADFAGFYIVSQDHMGTASHAQTTELVYGGTYAHKGWIYGANPPSTATVNNSHRAYPTIQFQKTPEGVFTRPVMVELWVWADVALTTGQWFSFATLTPDPTDAWARVVTVNLNDQGFVQLHHVPQHGQAQHLFQTTTLPFPLRQWVKLGIYIDFDPVDGKAFVWQDDQLVSYARVSGGDGTLAQLHFGLYADARLSSGVVYNDDLVIYDAVPEPTP